MNKTEHLLTCVAEECSEIAKDACKALRFGVNDWDPKDPKCRTNIERMTVELNDLIAVIDLLAAHGIMPHDWINKEAQHQKKIKVAEMFNYAQERGALQS